MAIYRPAYVATFSGQLYFRRRYFFILLQSNYFDTTVTFRSSHFFRSSTFFDELLFQNSHFFAAVIFSEQLLFQSETPTEPLLENRKFFRVVTFWNSYLSGGGIQKRYFFEAGTQHQMFQSEFSRKAISRIIHFFLESYLFRHATFSNDVIFSLAAIFSEEIRFYNILFQKNYHFSTNYVQLKCGSSFLSIYYCSKSHH